MVELREEGKPYREIAERANLGTPDAARMLVFRARLRDPTRAMKPPPRIHFAQLSVCGEF